MTFWYERVAPVHIQHTNKQPEGGDEVGWGMFFSLKVLIIPPLCVLISRHQPSGAVGMFISIPLSTARWLPHPTPTQPFHTLIWNQKCFLALCACVCVSDRDPLSTSNHLSHFTLSLNPPGSTLFFKQILAPTLFLLTVRGFVSHPRHKTPIHSTS